MLCTPDRTYALRSVVLSNSVLVVAPEPGGSAVVVQDILNEVIELVPPVPRLHRLHTLLRGMEWDEGGDETKDPVRAVPRNPSPPAGDR